ncbi:hypothetical protein SAMN05421858_0421 [Haladaptatus litoreus]|uniref:DUF2795 domain-containing protein n=1 Tax=Haladaptatus litoreus TaxID=553468 RepID=A0A1N6VNN6_9EURY|nr:hypothetical protein [Haladaptatus litoreus]SIQ79306.1 hypothetical protein SAMN05421858_0421 [Haladaptatus litoreus]
MARSVKFSHLESELQRLSYPVSREEATEKLDDVTVLFAEGEENLGKLVSQTEQEEYDSVEDIDAEINNVLPREAVGEPYQSEGEG